MTDQDDVHHAGHERLQVMKDADFKVMSDWIRDNMGIKMPHEKKVMLESRLAKRLRALSMKSFSDYTSFLFSDKGLTEEIQYFINCVSTNKTDFYRESSHFDFMKNSVLPELFKDKTRFRYRKLHLWSAACSSGEEPYTLAMVMEDYLETLRSRNPGIAYVILATDISTRVLDIAKRAVYPEESCIPLPHSFRTRYLLKSKDTERRECRVTSELRSKVIFHQLNLMSENYQILDPIDIVFCRNVLIYFDKNTQESIIRKLAKHIVPGGYLFIGHSETLINMDLPFEMSAPTIYRRLS